MPRRSSKAKSIIDKIIAETECGAPTTESLTRLEKNPAVAALGKLGGLKGGKAISRIAHAGKTQRDS